MLCHFRPKKTCKTRIFIANQSGFQGELSPLNEKLALLPQVFDSVQLFSLLSMSTLKSTHVCSWRSAGFSFIFLHTFRVSNRGNYRQGCCRLCWRLKSAKNLLNDTLRNINNELCTDKDTSIFFLIDALYRLPLWSMIHFSHSRIFALG